MNELVLVGLDAAYCVNATTRGARNRGYKVTVISGCVATESGRPMADILAGYAAAGAAVTSSAEFLQRQAENR